MTKTLSDSSLDRKNNLNNPYAIDNIQKEVGIKSTLFEGEYKFTARQLADFVGMELIVLR